MRKGYVFSILLLTVIVSLPAVAQKRNRQFASWQGKWDDFVAEFNACMASKPCDPATRFYGKVVSWQGTVEKVTDVISVEMGPLRLNDREGKAGDSVTCYSQQRAEATLGNVPLLVLRSPSGESCQQRVRSWEPWNSTPLVARSSRSCSLWMRNS